MSPTVVRDPLYGYVELSETEWEVVDSPAFQRLRNIKQLSSTHLVYPSAVHTRFEHSLGAMHVAGLMADRLGLEDDDVEVARLALLVHDLGHGPFSHSFEDVLSCFNAEDVDHEQLGRVVLEQSGLLDGPLQEHGDRVLEVLAGEEKSVLPYLVSSFLDADKLDYLRRDSYHAGVAYGTFDFHRIVDSLRITQHYLAIHEKGVDSLEGFRLARLGLHAQVYSHHVRLISDRMLARAAVLAIEDGHLPKEAFVFDAADPEDFVDRFLGWNDHSFLRLLTDTTDGRAKDLATRLCERRLYKRGSWKRVQFLPTIFRLHLLDGSVDLQEMERDIAERAGVGAHEVFVVDSDVDTKQYATAWSGGAEDAPLLVETYDGEVRALDDYPLITGPSEPIRTFYVFGPKDARDAVGEAAEDWIGTYEG